MILTVADILKDAMGLIGVIEIDESPTGSEMNTALRAANVMIDRWSTQRLLLRSTASLIIPLVVNKSSYTVGPVGADIIAQKPTKLYSAFVRDGSNNDIYCEIIEYQTYNNLDDKVVSSGNVDYVAYDPGNAQQTTNVGTIYAYHPPASNDTLYLEVDNYLNEFVNFTDTVKFEPAYYEALIYNLAVRLFRYYNDSKAQVPIDIVTIASSALTNLKALNSVKIVSGMDLPGNGGRYNILTDGAN